MQHSVSKILTGVEKWPNFLLCLVAHKSWKKEIRDDKSLETHPCNSDVLPSLLSSPFFPPLISCSTAKHCETQWNKRGQIPFIQPELTPKCAFFVWLCHLTAFMSFSYSLRFSNSHSDLNDAKQRKEVSRSGRDLVLINISSVAALSQDDN